MGFYNVVAIDGSLQNFGTAVVTVSSETKKIKEVLYLGLNKTAPSTDKKARKSYDDLARFQSHWGYINGIITKYDCKVAVAEIPSGGQDARAAFAFGGITAMMGCLPIPLTPVTPSECKASSGSKHADKEDMIQWAYQQWPDASWITSKRTNAMNIKTAKGLYLTNANEHLADSLGIAVAGLKYL